MSRVIGLGAGGHAGVVIEIIRMCGIHHVEGLLDPNPGLWGSELLGVPVLGDDSILRKLHKQGVHHAFIGLGSVGDMRPRKSLFELAIVEGFEIVNTIHPCSAVSPSAQVGQGATIMAGAIINTAAQLGKNVIVNTGAIIEHNCIVGDHVHVATGARLAGNVSLGQGVHVGIGASVRQCIHIGSESVVGAGAVVIDDVPARVVVVGSPARLLRNVG